LKVEDEDKEPGRVQRVFTKVSRGYERVLRTILRFRWAYLGAMIGLFALGGYMMGLVPQKFFPNSDRAQILVYADLPVGVTSRATDRAVQEMMRIAGDREAFPGLIDHAAYVGFGGPRFVLSLAPVDPAPNTAFMVINAKDRDAAEKTIPKLRDAFRATLPDVETRVSRMFLGPADPNVIQLQIRGPDTDYVLSKAAEVEEMLLSLDHTIDVWHDWHGVIERMAVRIDPDSAARAGVTATDIAETLSRRTDGQRIGSVQDGDDLVPIVLRGFPSERDSIDQLLAAPVFNGRTGNSVPLSQVARLEREPGIGVIAREDLVRTLTVEARNLSLTPQDMQPLLAERLEEFSASLKPGHTAEFDGILDDTAESNAALAATMPIVLFLTLLLLIVQFKGFKRPAIILISLPFVVFGAAVGLLVMQASFGFMVILGLYALLGLIINNAIVLVDRMDIEIGKLDEQSDADRLDALIEACARRFQPIIMTTITTIIGFLPLIISQDVLFYGMASAMAFGLGISTLIISLGLVPVLYALFFHVKGRASEEKPETQPSSFLVLARAAE
jgi:multidrug efflux pump subunit AcrB